MLGGTLGAGKTTIVNQLLTNADRRVAVIVNDFGSINIDAGLIASQTDDVIELSNGCICCAIADGLVMALLELSEWASLPDHVVIEASGVANPAKVANYAHMPGFRLDGILVAVDGEQFPHQLGDQYIGTMVADQVAAADVVVVTKSDLAETAATLQAVTGLTTVPVVVANHGHLDPAVLYGPRLLSDPALDNPALDNPALISPAGAAATADPPAFVTATGTTPTEDPDQLRAWLAQAPEGTLRAKGKWFDLVGKRISVRSKDAGPSPVVVIGVPGTGFSRWLEPSADPLAESGESCQQSPES